MNLKKNGVYIHCAYGKILIDNYVLNAGYALGIYEIVTIALKAEENSELIFVALPMGKGVNVLENRSCFNSGT